MKYKIKQLSIETSRYLNLSKRTVHKYEQRINDIKDTNKHLEKQELMYLKQKVQKYYDQQLSALKIRARIKYFEENEKSTKCFFNTEKKNVNDKIWTKIKCKDGTFKTDIKSILKEQTEFYQTLFKSEGYNENEANELLNKADSKFTEEEKQLIGRNRKMKFLKYWN